MGDRKRWLRDRWERRAYGARAPAVLYRWCQGTREARWNGKGEVYRSWRLKRRDQGQRTEESKGDCRQSAGDKRSAGTRWPAI